MEQYIPEIGIAAARYQQLSTRRQQFLDRARLCSQYTIPSVLPPEGHSSGMELYKPFQSIGARGVNNLASRLLLTLIPPTRRFFRLVTTKKLDDELLPEEKGQIETALVNYEEQIDLEMVSRGTRVRAFEAFRHLVIAGNVLVFEGEDNTRVYPLSQYVVARDNEGNLLEIVVKESVSPLTIDDSVREKVLDKLGRDQKSTDAPASYGDVDLYTRVYLDDKVWRVYQEVCGLIVPKSVGNYGKRKNPWMALRWHRIDGEDYGRGHCDDYIGDIIAAERLSRSIIRFAAIASKIVFLVKKNGMTDPKDLQDANEGDFIDGDKEDIAPLTLEKFPDFQVAKSVLDEVTTRLSYAFLLNSAIQRQAERVTAEEIRYMAQELENTLGGVYSVLSLEYQLPLVEAIMSQMMAKGVLPKLQKEAVRPTIVTGIDALGRSSELARLDAFIGGALQTFGPQVLQFIEMPDYLARRANGLDINPKGLVKTPEQIAQIQQQQQMMGLAQAVGPEVVKAASQNAQTTPPNG